MNTFSGFDMDVSVGSILTFGSRSELLVFTNFLRRCKVDDSVWTALRTGGAGAGAEAGAAGGLSCFVGRGFRGGGWGTDVNSSISFLIRGFGIRRDRRNPVEVARA